MVPVFNEARTIEAVLDLLARTEPPTGFTRRIVAVDDGSSDGTGEILARLAIARPELLHLKHPVNSGKGRALRTALDAAMKESGAAAGDLFIIHDADFEYDPADHGAVLKPLIDGKADAVIGSRFLGQPHRVLYFWHYVINRFITLLSDVMTNLNLTDIECCTKAFTREVAARLTIVERGFGVEPEIVARLSRMRVPSENGGTRRLRIFEVPVSYSGRTYAEGKKIKWTDGVWALWCIAKYGVMAGRKG